MATLTSHEGSPASEDARSLKRSLLCLLAVYVLGMLCLQAFNLIFQQVGTELGEPGQASLITAVPGVVLGVVAFLYGSLGDFVSLRKMEVAGIVVLVVSSVAGFLLSGSLLLVIVWRSLQTAAAQVSGSVFLVMVARYLKGPDKAIYLGLFTAGFQLSMALGSLAGGIMSEVGWRYLFLASVAAVVFLPLLARSLPDEGKGAGHIDIIGFCLFGCAVTLLALFFSASSWPLLAVSVILFGAFVVYIHRAAAPFVTPAFFHNVSWLMAASLVLVFYFINFSFAPLYNLIGTEVLGTTSVNVALVLLPAFLVAVVMASFSGRIVHTIGHTVSIVLASSLLLGGLVASALSVEAGSVALAGTACVVYAGFGLLYSPLVDTVLACVAPEQGGRAVGMNDLTMNVSASIGISIYGGLMASGGLSGASVIGAAGAAATASNLLLAYALSPLLGLILYLVFRRRLHARAA